MKKIAVLTGAGISAESGLATFRGAGGLWEGHNIYEVATPEAWEKNPAMVLRFYNQRRRDIRLAQPNAAHKALVLLEEYFHVSIITQNIDDLHERAGSTNVFHLHGEILKARSSIDDKVLYDLGEKDIEMGDFCDRGSQLRPHVIWFGEAVSGIYEAMDIVQQVDLLVVIGTSLAVYPAASLVPGATNASDIFIVNPEIPSSVSEAGFHLIRETACAGVPPLVDRLCRTF